MLQEGDHIRFNIRAQEVFAFAHGVFAYNIIVLGKLANQGPKRPKSVIDMGIGMDEV